MAHIAPDEDEDSHFLHVLTEGHDSDSSEGQIQSGQDLLQQAPSSPSGLMLPVSQADFTQASAIDQGCSFFTTSAQVHSEQDTSPPPPPARRPQRIAGLHRGGIVDNIASALDTPSAPTVVDTATNEDLENQNALQSTARPQVIIGKRSRKRNHLEVLDTPEEPSLLKKPKSPKPLLKKGKKLLEPRVQAIVEEPPLQQELLQKDALITVDQWLKAQEVVDRRFEVISKSFHKTTKKLQKVKARAKARQDEHQITIKQLQESLARTTSGIKAYIQEKDTEEIVTTAKLFKTLKKYIPDLIKEEKQDKTRGCASSSVTTRKLNLSPDISDSWLQPPTPGPGEVIGFFPPTQEFPTTDKFLVPKNPEAASSDNPNWPNPLPFAFSSSTLQNFLNSPSLVQNNKIQLDSESFDPTEMPNEKGDNWHVVDAHARKVLVENLVVDQLIEKSLDRMKQTKAILETDPEAPIKWKRELDLYQSLLETAFAANLRGRHTTSAMLVTNKLKARNKFLSRCTAPDYSKKIMKHTAFASPTLFGPTPDVLKLKIRESLGNRDKDFVIRPRKKFSTQSRSLRSNFYDRWRPRGHFQSKNSRPKPRGASTSYSNPSSASYYPSRQFSPSSGEGSSAPFRTNQGTRNRPRTRSARGNSRQGRRTRR